MCKNISHTLSWPLLYRAHCWQREISCKGLHQSSCLPESYLRAQMHTRSTLEECGYGGILTISERLRLTKKGHMESKIYNQFCYLIYSLRGWTGISKSCGMVLDSPEESMKWKAGKSGGMEQNGNSQPQNFYSSILGEGARSKDIMAIWVRGYYTGKLKYW